MSGTLGAAGVVAWDVLGLVASTPFGSGVGAAGAGGQRLVGPAGYVLAGYSFTRAGPATDIPDAGGLVEYLAGVLRNGSANGPLLEGAGLNRVRNPRAEGSTAGIVGTGSGVWPTNWQLLYGSAGLDVTIVGTGVEQGIPYIDVRFSGTATAAGFPAICPETFTGIAATNGQAWTASLFCKLVAGSLAGIDALQPGWQYMDGVGSQLQFFQQTIVPTGAALATQRTAIPGTTANATTTNAVPFLDVAYSNGAVVDCTLRIGGFQFEQAVIASSLILPPVAAPAAQSRILDSLIIGGASFAAIFGQGAPTGFVVVDVFLPAAMVGSSRYLFDITDGTNNNRMGVRTATGGTIVTAGGALAGAGSQSSNISFAGYGAVVRFGFRWNATGYDVTYAGAALIATAQVKVPHDRLVIGNTNNGASPIFGRIAGLWGGSLYPSTAGLRAASANGADVLALIGT